jgi:23S rRNA pseudouridine1911/1915/1917 synthase
VTSHSFIIPDATSGQRLDKTLATAWPQLTRSRLQQLIAQGHLTRDGLAVTDASRKVKPGEQYQLTEPEPEPAGYAPLDLALDIVFEDAHFLIINKPPGLTVHPAAGNGTHTLVNALLHHCADTLSGIGGVARPGIVHRIDKDTSGLLVVAKTDAAHQHLVGQLKDRSLKREYIAYAWGAPPAGRGSVNAPIARNPRKRKEMAVVEGGKHAVTHYEVLERFLVGEESKSTARGGASPEPSLLRSAGARSRDNAKIVSKLLCNLDTGRTHQIRVHMRHIGCPLIGDPLYGAKSRRLSVKNTLNIGNKGAIVSNQETVNIQISLSRQALHACRLRLVHPETGQPMQFEAPLPEDLENLENSLRSLTF